MSDAQKRASFELENRPAPFDADAVQQALADSFGAPFGDTTIPVWWVWPGHGQAVTRLGPVAGRLHDAWAMVAGMVGGKVARVDGRWGVVIEPAMWSADQVLERLAEVGTPISRSTWDAYVARGQAPRTRERGRWSQLDVERWIASRPGRAGRITDEEADIRMVVAAVVDGDLDPAEWQATDRAGDDPASDRRQRVAAAIEAARSAEVRAEVASRLGGWARVDVDGGPR